MKAQQRIHSISPSRPSFRHCRDLKPKKVQSERIRLETSLNFRIFQNRLDEPDKTPASIDI